VIKKFSLTNELLTKANSVHRIDEDNSFMALSCGFLQSKRDIHILVFKNRAMSKNYYDSKNIVSLKYL